ncbi:MAG: hypothetical protein KUG71_14080 [Porticoccaceae bacterium]|nr:hypothetical protein [Porticoccaceae bacterium]
MARKQNDYDHHQSVKSFWFSGSPLKQLSPEAITELCFRFSNHFPHSGDLSTVRGICVSASELDKTTLALLAGLKFNCVEIYIDASIASNDRSLSKIEAGLRLMSDYEHIRLNFKIRFGDQTHPGFLIRLLALLEGSNCQQIELVCQQTLQGDSTPEIMTSTHQLLDIHRHFDKLDWTSCGNNFFYAPQHENHALLKRRNLRMTPWGYHSQDINTQLGVGVGALSLIDDTYELNTIDPDIYQQCITKRKALPTTQYKLGRHCNDDLIKHVQELVCYHQTLIDVDDRDKLFSPLINQGWLRPGTAETALTDQGLINLNAIAKFLFSHINNAGYNAGDSQTL